jgi:glyoxylase-like metal-dependent hydrolase (beta-lactamase superfamily II)
MTGRGTNTYLIGTREVVVVDPGPDIPEHVEAIVAAAGDDGGRIVAQLLTHGHSDHLGGAALVKARTAAPIFGHARLPGVDQIVGDGEEIELGEARFTAYETLGHADDHLCYRLSPGWTLFTGDLVAGSGTVVLSQTSGSLTRYLASLQRMYDLGPMTLMPGHGPTVPDGRARIKEYLEHRATRERQIADALLAGPASVDVLVRRIYVETPRELYAMAAHNVQAHLEHLAVQGRVAVNGSEWRLIVR